MQSSLLITLLIINYIINDPMFLSFILISSLYIEALVKSEAVKCQQGKFACFCLYIIWIKLHIFYKLHLCVCVCVCVCGIAQT